MRDETNNQRGHRYKKPRLEFFCPLCGSERVFTTTYRLSAFQYGQIVFMAVALTGLLYPLTGMRGLFFIFPLWMGYEWIVRARFRREIPCPHCGFDASWYQRDLRITRAKVKDFWAEKGKGAAVRTAP